MTKNLLQSTILRKELDEALGPGIDSGDEVMYFCPLCVTVGKTPDTKGKMYVNFTKKRPDASPGVFFCFRCESAGSLERLFRHMGISLEDKTPTSEAFQKALKVFHGEEHDEVQVEPEQIIDHTRELGKIGCYLVKPGEPEYEYLLARGLSHEDMRYYKILTGQKKYYSRVIVPTFTNDKTVPFFVARAIRPLFFNTPEGRIEAPKYFNPKGEERRRCLFNLDKMSGERIIVTEGVFSAIAAGKDAVASFGKLVTEKQIGLLHAEAQGREVVVCLDGDAHAEGVNLAARLDARGVRVSVILLPREADPASLPQGTTLDDFMDQRWRYTIPNLLERQVSGQLVGTKTIDRLPRHEVSFASSVERFLRALEQ